MAERISVGVLVRFGVGGSKTPLGIIWTYGRKLLINYSSNAQRMASTRTGGDGARYACRIGRWSFYLIEEDGCWFVKGR